MRVDFDKDGNAELLHEQTFLQQSAAGRQRKVCYERKECHEDAARKVRQIPDTAELTEKLKQYGESLPEGVKALLGVLAFVLFLILSVARW
jgi:hypothetical protein